MANCSVFHQLATSKGLISGDLCYVEEDGRRIDCSSSQAVAVSSNIGGIRSIPGSVCARLLWTRASVFLDWRADIASSAKFVLIVEKDATFQRLLDDGFCTKLSPCILITVCPPASASSVVQTRCLEPCICLCMLGQRRARRQQQVDGEKAVGHAPRPHLGAGGRRPSR